MAEKRGRFDFVHGPFFLSVILLSQSPPISHPCPCPCRVFSRTRARTQRCQREGGGADWFDCWVKWRERGKGRGRKRNEMKKKFKIIFSILSSLSLSWQDRLADSFRSFVRIPKPAILFFLTLKPPSSARGHERGLDSDRPRMSFPRSDSTGFLSLASRGWYRTGWLAGWLMRWLAGWIETRERQRVTKTKVISSAAAAAGCVRERKRERNEMRLD